MPDGKWITGLAPDTPLSAAARSALTVRLTVVRDHLPLAVHHADEDLEHVHQLRVATRRAGAAVRIFGPCLPDRHRRRVKKLLRRYRRAAGDARDWDVFQALLAAWAARRPDPERPGLDFLMGFARARRVDAQAALVAIDLEREFEQLPQDTSNAVHPSGKAGTFADLALPMLTELADEFNAAVAVESDDPDHLHQVRIAGKRLRYAMEVFADCFTPPFREALYPLVEEVQETLGSLHDSHVTAGRLEEIRDELEACSHPDRGRLRPGIDRWLQWHRRRVPQERRRFRTWCKRWQTAARPLNELLLAPVRPSQEEE